VQKFSLHADGGVVHQDVAPLYASLRLQRPNSRRPRHSSNRKESGRSTTGLNDLVADSIQLPGAAGDESHVHSPLRQDEEQWASPAPRPAPVTTATRRPKNSFFPLSCLPTLGLVADGFHLCSIRGKCGPDMPYSFPGAPRYIEKACGIHFPVHHTPFLFPQPAPRSQTQTASRAPRHRAAVPGSQGRGRRGSPESCDRET
jgi:hypothetical protein